MIAKDDGEIVPGRRGGTGADSDAARALFRDETNLASEGAQLRDEVVVVSVFQDDVGYIHVGDCETTD